MSNADIGISRTAQEAPTTLSGTKKPALLIKLERHKEELYRGEGKRTPAVAVARIIKTLELEYLKEMVNYHWILGC